MKKYVWRAAALTAAGIGTAYIICGSPVVAYHNWELKRNVAALMFGETAVLEDGGA